MDDLVKDKENNLQSISGIYSITNIINNKVYIGESMNIKRRWQEHINDLKNNRHCNYLLQNDYNTYGINNLNFNIIQEYKIESQSIEKCRLLILEHKYIKKYEKENIKLYNLEYSLEKILNGDKAVFNESESTELMLKILVGQIIKFKFIWQESKFILMERNTTLSMFTKLGGYSSCSKSKKKYIKFIGILNDKYYNELGEIFKKFKLKYKFYDLYKDITIEEVTDYGISIFEKIFADNEYLKCRKINHSKNTTYNEKAKKPLPNKDIPISDFIKYVASLPENKNRTKVKIKNWFVELGIISIYKNHMYVSTFSIDNKYLIKKSRCYDKINEVEFYTIMITKKGQEYIVSLLND